MALFLALDKPAADFLSLFLPALVAVFPVFLDLMIFWLISLLISLVSFKTFITFGPPSKIPREESVAAC